MAKQWFVLRVQPGREDTVKEALWKRIQTQNLESKFSSLMVPTERVTEIKGGRRRTYNRRTFPGYVMAEIEVDEQGNIPDEVWFLIRETPGVGDFLGAYNKPTPMSPEDVDRMLFREAESITQEAQVKIDFEPGDQVKIKEGPFENFDGTVEEVFPQKGIVKVVVNIFGRQTPVELEYWQVEAI
ncbi:MAG: transcription termination/antitermination protein NusG [Planctomycetota bacterium]|nr:MAG: transcription termination/antitermination protein NusG [Planctomycetota bacterium]